MATSEETIHEAAEALVSWTRELTGLPMWGSVSRDVAHALADAGLLRQETTEEYVIGDGFGEPELWRGTFGSREEAEAALACDCHREILRRWVTAPEEVRDGE